MVEGQSPDLTLILAGGRGRRMGGGDKGLLPLTRGDTLLSFLSARLSPQCGALAISANGDPQRFAALGLPVIADPIGPDFGPLAGVLAGLDHVAADRSDGWLLTVPGDTPLVPLDLAVRLGQAARDDGALCVRATSGGRRHPLVALWSARLREPLRRAVGVYAIRKVEAFQEAHAVLDVSWPCEPCDPFLNANTPTDLAAVRRAAARHGRTSPLADREHLDRTVRLADQRVAHLGDEMRNVDCGQRIGA